MAQGNSEDPRAGIRVIRTNTEYAKMRRALDRLLDIDPPAGSPDRDRLEMLLVLLADYEARTVPAPAVDPVDAIVFRMDQLGLKHRDLEPYLGGRSRVSEVLSRRRPLSIAMIRALHEGLGIPAEALINPASPPEDVDRSADIPWERFPIRELISRGWVHAEHSEAWTRAKSREILAPLFEFSNEGIAMAPLYRRTAHVRAAKGMDTFALSAWTARVLQLAKKRPPATRFDRQAFESEQIRSLVGLSCTDDGPLKAREWLAARGVVMVVESHLPRTRLDGAAMLAYNNVPVVALTLRYDRLDNFWFTLLHECAHILCHLAGVAATDTRLYFDDLDVEGVADPREIEADTFARDSLVPSAIWKASAVAFAPSVDAAIELANQVGVSPAVIAGRVRHEKRNFRLLGPLVGAGKVRRLFPEVHFD